MDPTALIFNLRQFLRPRVEAQYHRRGATTYEHMEGEHKAGGT